MNRDRWAPISVPFLLILISALVVGARADSWAQQIFSDGFESGDTAAWSSTVPPPFPGVADPSFEAGPSGGFWAEASTAFGTPVCDTSSCGTGTGTGPRTGTYWAWLGGADSEVGSVSQTLVLPSGSSATLRFHLELPVCDSSSFAYDVFEVRVNGLLVYNTDNTDPACDSTGYLERLVDISAYLGTSITLHFEGRCDVSEPTNFFLDDVAILHVP